MAEQSVNGNGARQLRQEIGAWVTRAALIALTSLAVWTGQRIVEEVDGLGDVLIKVEQRLTRVEAWIEFQRAGRTP